MSSGLRGGARSIALGAGVGIVFFVVAYSSIIATRGEAFVAPFWLANTLGLVFLLRLARGRADSLALLFGVAVAGVVANALTRSSRVEALVFGLENGLEIALSAALARRFATTRFKSVAQGWRFFTAAGPPAAVMGGLVAGAMATASGAAAPWQAAGTWAAADLLGFVLVAPLGMTISSREIAKLDLRRRWPEAAALAALVLAVTLGAFLQRTLPLLFVVAPFLLLATFRFGLIGANAAVLLAAAVAIPLTYLGDGPLALVQADLQGLRLIVLQSFLALNGLTAVPIAAALGERSYLSGLAKRREEELAAVNRNLTNTVASTEFAERVAGLGYWRIEAPSGEVIWSSGMYAIFGRDPKDGPMLSSEIIRHSAVEGAEKLAAVAQAIEARTGVDFEFAIGGDRGDVRHLMVRARFVEHPGGSGTLLGLVRDVTGDKALEARYRLLTENANDLVTEMDAQGAFTYASPSVKAMTGYEPSEVIGRVAIEFIHPGDRERVAALFKEALKGPPGWQVEYRIICKDGRNIWVEARPTLARDPFTGRATGVTDVIRDVTARKAAEEALSSSEARYRLLAENATDMISRYGLDGTIRYVSPACAEVLGFTPEELAGRTTLELIHPDDLDAVRAVFASYISAPVGAAPIQTEHRVIRKDGQVIWLEGRPRLVRDDQGRPIEYHDVMREVTARKRLQAELEQAKLAAEAGARVKADFLANMSHELRTPLNSILGFSGLIAKAPELAPETRRRADLVLDASRSLVSIVNDVLDLSKIEAEGVALDLQPVDLEAVLEQAADLVRENATSKGLRLDVSVSRLVAPVLADPVRLRQVVLNLLGNAVKFTAQGRIHLSLSETSQGHLRIAVQDTGVGIPSDRLSAVFDRFAQADGSTSRRFGGTGLGLAISRSIVQAMGGEMGVESRLGEGSIFWFTFLPILAQSLPSLAAAAATATAAPDVRGLRVLLADDNDVNRDLFRALLAPSGLEITEAADGSQALAVLEGADFDIVFMDVQMPVMDGLEATRTLRARGVRLPIIALTANVMASQVETYRQAGMSDYLSKPYEIEDVLRMIVDHVQEKRGCEGRETAACASATIEALRRALGETALDDILGRLAEQLRSMATLLAETDADPAELGRRVHGVRGLAGTLGFAEINRRYAALEDCCRKGHARDAEQDQACRATWAALHDIERLRA